MENLTFRFASAFEGLFSSSSLGTLEEWLSLLLLLLRGTWAESTSEGSGRKEEGGNIRDALNISRSENLGCVRKG